jgi:hypothetical protein
VNGNLELGISWRNHPRFGRVVRCGPAEHRQQRSDLLICGKGADSPHYFGSTRDQVGDRVSVCGFEPIDKDDRRRDFGAVGILTAGTMLDETLIVRVVTFDYGGIDSALDEPRCVARGFGSAGYPREGMDDRVVILSPGESIRVWNGGDHLGGYLLENKQSLLFCKPCQPVLV